MNIDPTKLRQFLTKKQYGGSIPPFYQNPLEYRSPFSNNNMNQVPPNQGNAINPLAMAFPNNTWFNPNNSFGNLDVQTPNRPTQEDFNLWNTSFTNSTPQTEGLNTITMETPTGETSNTITTPQQDVTPNPTTLSDEDYQTWKRLDAKAKAGKQKPTENLNLINPYGNAGIESSLAYGAYQAGLGNTGQASLGFGRGLFGLARTGLNAYSAGQNYKQGLRAQDNDSIVNYSNLEKGGEVKVSELLTSKYTTDSSNPTVEVENGEQILNSKTGIVSEAVGETHENGGVKTNLPAGSKVLSDHLTLGNKGAKEISKELDIKAKAKDTYAEVLEKYSNKIGVNKNIKEEAKLIEKTEKAMSLEDNDTKDLNAMYLEKDFKRVQEEKVTLNSEQQQAFDKLYEKQEASKPMEEQSQMFQEGGEVDPEQVFQELIAQGMSEEEAIAYMEQMQGQEQTAPQDDITAQIQALLEQGETPENILQMLVEQGYSEEEAVQVVQSAMPQMQDGGETGRGTTQGFYKQLEALSEQLGVALPKINVNATGKAKDVEWGKMQAWLNTNAPDVVEKYMRNQPLTNKGMRNLFATKKEELKAVGIDVNRKPESFTPEERRALQSKIQLDGDFLRDAFNDNLSEYRYPEVGIVGKVNTAGRTDNQITAPLLTEPQLLAPQTAEEQTQANRTAIPMFPTVDGLPPSAMLIPRTDQVTFNRIRPTTITPEVAIASANNQSNFAVEQAYANNPNIAAFAAANLIGTTQQSANQAINQADMYNAQANDKANLYNAQVGDKEQLMNIELANNYERRLFTSLGNQEADWNRYFTQKSLQNKQNWMDVNNLQLNNAMFPNYQSDGTNIYFQNPANFNGEQRQNQMDLDRFYKALTPEQQLALIKRNNQ